MNMNPYLMGGSIISSNKPLMVFTGTNPEYPVEDYLNAVTANSILNIGPEPVYTTLHQKLIHRRRALIQTTLDGAAQKRFLDWKHSTKNFQKCSTVKKINNIKDFFATKSLDFLIKQLSNLQ